jgi:hypothetical protein
VEASVLGNGTGEREASCLRLLGVEEERVVSLLLLVLEDVEGV